MKLVSWIVSWAIGFAGAFAIWKIQETSETDWFGLPKLLVAIVFFVVFTATGTVMMRSLCSKSAQKHKDRVAKIEESDE